MYFTVCIPTYNRSYIIGRALDSLVRQSFKDFEVLVVDDGSSDNTEETVSCYQDKLNLKYIKKKNGGKHTALNIGIEAATGIFFLILDSDDWLIDDGLEQMYKLCESIIDNPDYSGVLMRCLDSITNKMIGDKIPVEMNSISYVDLHFNLRKRGIELGDCCECNRTELLKQYRFPEEKEMKFVPEAWLFDQIGLTYTMVASNIIIKKVNIEMTELL